MYRILSAVLILLIASCKQPTEAIPTSDPIKSESNFKKIKERIEITSGYLSVYVYGTDTLYIVEGNSSSYPVGIAIK